MENKNYYLGLDMGTSSVGWAVTDDKYQLLRKKGKDMWGIREFDEASPSAERRSHRIARRRRQRQEVRVGLLKGYFADEIEKVDELFFIRLENSKYFLEDKNSKLGSKNGIFDDADYKDADYYKDYPTIFHLRKALLDLEETGKIFDVRLVYLALLNMFKHRGHFLLNIGENEELSAERINIVYLDLIEQLNKNYGLRLADIPVAQVLAVIGDRETGRKQKHEKIVDLFKISKKNKKENEFLKGMCGLSINANLIFEEDAEGKVPLCFHDFSYTDKIPELMESLGDDNYAVIEQMKRIYDYAILSGILNGYNYLSLARVDSYKKHKDDLKCLQNLYRKYKSSEDYDRMFRSDEKGTYSAYVNSLNSSNSTAEYRKYRRNMDGRKAEDLYATIKKDFKGITEDTDVQYVLEQIEKEHFLPKQLTGANGVIPNQVHKKEMKRILSNAEKYLPFLKEKDQSGLTVSERILQLFSFQIPYYVGPTGKNSKTGWAVRKDDGGILPWNIKEKIDMKATSEAFIKNLVRSCTYIAGEKVMPKASLAYERYCVLNEINNIRIDGERIEPELKQRLYTECFCKGKRVTRKQICDFFVGEGVIRSAEQVTGVDITIHNSLSSYGKMYAIFGDKLKEDKYRSIAEDIIYWGTIFSDSKDMFRQHLVQYEEQDILTEKDIKRILGYKFKDWGRFSKALLELQGCDKSTGELLSIGRAMWDYNLNFMELINSDAFTFREALEEKKIRTAKVLTDFVYEDLDDYYFSAPVKRMVWQTILVVKEIEQIMGYAPKRVFVEMTRNDEEKGDKGRKASRGNRLLEAYKNMDLEDIDKWMEEISAADSNGKLRSKKLYLYYMQMGRDMYTGEMIDLGRLFDDNLYDIDHIYPRHYVKDDSMINNLVLVNKAANEHLKKDLYPIPASIVSNPKVRELWKYLHGNHLISDEKYSRLMSRTAFTEKQMGDFIARQLVETGQGTKGAAELLKQLLPSDTEIIYAKASNVSEFRNKNGFLKSRLVNEFHHAQDAYLNIVVGNVYYTKFTRNPWNFIREDYAKDKRKNHYNLDKMFSWDVTRNGVTAWIASKEDTEGTIATVRKVMSKNTPLMTRMSFECHGEIANATLYSAKKAKPENYFAIKTADPRMADVKKYGGYTSASIAYYFVVRHKEGKKENVTIEGLPLYQKSVVESSANGLEEYCRRQLGYENVEILLRKIRVQVLLEIRGYRMYLSGKTGNRFLTRNAVNLCISQNWANYIKKIEKAVDADIQEKTISREKNLELYDVLMEKHLNAVFSKRPNPVGEKLRKRRETFDSLDISKQCFVLYQILQLTKIGITVANLTDIGESENTGKMLVSKNIKEADHAKIICQSVTGLYEKEIPIFG